MTYRGILTHMLKQDDFRVSGEPVSTNGESIRLQPDFGTSAEGG